MEETKAHLVQGADGGLEDHVGVEEEGAEQRLRVGCQLGQDASQQQVDVKRVGQHVLQTRQQHTHKWTYRERGTSFLLL